jgi:4,5-DOPA dioxygenase extradiol
MTQQKMPMLFAGHGSPMSAIENNEFTMAWERIGQALPRPKAILSISAHWTSRGLEVQPQEQPQQIYDMYGFPKALYDLKYPAKGSPELAAMVEQLVQTKPVQADTSWGIDHGTWAVLCKISPQADIPVVQLSIDLTASPAELYQIGKELQPLREQGILLFASGDVVHNLRRLDWERPNGFDWADAFDKHIRDNIVARNDEAVINYQAFGEAAQLSCPTPEHFYPLLYVLGAASPDDKITVFNDARTMGSLSMTGYLWQ